MYIIIRIALTICLFWSLSSKIPAQTTNHQSLEIGLAISGLESIYYGLYGKYNIPISKKKHHFNIGFSLTSYFDFIGESRPDLYLKNNVDMRLIPAAYLGYSFTFKKTLLGVEIPLGTSLAITKGTLVSERIGFEQDYSNVVFLWHYGIETFVKYQLTTQHQIGLRVFIPLTKDKVGSSYLIGIGWTVKIINKKNLSPLSSN